MLLARGGVARMRGVTPAMGDVVPSLLTEGEVVLNKREQGQVMPRPGAHLRGDIAGALYRAKLHHYSGGGEVYGLNRDTADATTGDSIANDPDMVMRGQADLDRARGEGRLLMDDTGRYHVVPATGGPKVEINGQSGQTSSIIPQRPKGREYLELSRGGIAKAMDARRGKTSPTQRR